MTDQEVKSELNCLTRDIAGLISLSLSCGIVFAFASAEWLSAYDHWKALAVMALLLAWSVAASALHLYRASAQRVVGN